MMGRTHRAFAPVFWLACAAPAVAAGGLSLPAVAVGAVLAIPMSSGKTSPDCDHMIWPGRPKPGYHWRGHRGVTHRFWFAAVLTALLVAPVAALGGPLWAPLALAAGWWSHLAGDMWFGRLKVGRRSYGLGLKTGGPLEKPIRTYVISLAGVAAIVLNLMAAAY